jgi:uncharacterized protein YjbI with pentapeptide repeats
MARLLWYLIRAGLTRLRWLLAGLAAVAIVLVCVLVVPQWLVQWELGAMAPTLTAADRAKAINDVRATLLQGIGGVVILLGAYFTYRQLQIGREQLQIAQQGQVTERFTRAIDQLGNAELDVRLGGIYALERIGNDSPDDRATIAEVLTAFVRSHAPWPPRLPGQYVANAPIERLPELQVQAPDVQAALTVLARRRPPPTPSGRLDLHATDLRKALLYRANLQQTNLAGANLQGAQLAAANLQQVSLTGAQLQQAKLNYAELSQANLMKAELQGAHLDNVDFQGAHLHAANLQEASLYYAKFQEANLDHAELQRANLFGANLRKASLVHTDLREANLYSTNLQEAILHHTKLHGANLGNADLRGATLYNADLRGATLDRAQLQNTTLDSTDLEGASIVHAQF